MSFPWISPSTFSVISSPASACGVTRCGEQNGQTAAPCGPARAHASLSARQAKAAGLLTSGTYGLRSSTSYASADLASSLASKLRARTDLLGSTLYTLTWKARLTQSGRSIPALRASARRISDNDCTGWPTAAARDWKDGSQCDNVPINALLGRASWLAAWPTPLTSDTRSGVNVRAYRETNRDRGPRLCDVTVLAGWRTPTCQSPNSLRGHGQDPARRAEQGHTINLTDEVNWLKDNPRPARLTATGELLTGFSAGMESGGQLNPAHSRWLMGLPLEWDACAPTATRSSRTKPRSGSKHVWPWNRKITLDVVSKMPYVQCIN